MSDDLLDERIDAINEKRTWGRTAIVVAKHPVTHGAVALTAFAAGMGVKGCLETNQNLPPPVPPAQVRKAAEKPDFKAMVKLLLDVEKAIKVVAITDNEMGLGGIIDYKLNVVNARDHLKNQQPLNQKSRDDLTRVIDYLTRHNFERDPDFGLSKPFCLTPDTWAEKDAEQKKYGSMMSTMR